MFTIPWKPDKPGLWTLLLTFPGSKSYYSSYAITTVFVEGAAAAAAPVTYQQIQPLFVALLALIIVAIAIGIYNIYKIRKK